MEGEMSNFVQVCTAVVICLWYTYFAAKIVSKGFLRLLTFLPIICIFLLLPLKLSSMSLSGFTGFVIAWLANFKLLLLAFGRGPLATKISLGRYLTVACFPIKIRQEPPPQSPQNPQKPQTIGKGNGNPNGISNPQTQIPKNPSQESPPNQIPETPSQKHAQSIGSNPTFPEWVWKFGIKGLLFAIWLKVLRHRDHIHPKLLLCLYGFHIYFVLEVTLVLMGGLAKALLRIELDPPFDEPYLSSSLQDFWGRRWNIMATKILRPTVYDPVRGALAGILGRKWAVFPAVLATFAVSGLMHELIYYYLGRVRPTWEVTCFFLLHGACLAVEMAVKRAVRGAWRPPRMVSGPLAVAFVIVTGFWLFFPPLIRCGAEANTVEEIQVIFELVKNVGRLFRLDKVFRTEH